MNEKAYAVLLSIRSHLENRCGSTHGSRNFTRCTCTVRISSMVLTVGSCCWGHSFSDNKRKFGPVNHRLSDWQEGPFPHFVASSATLSLVGIQCHSSGCVSSRISPIRTATYCLYFLASEAIQERTVLESLQKNLRLTGRVWFSAMDFANRLPITAACSSNLGTGNGRRHFGL